MHGIHSSRSTKLDFQVFLILTGCPTVENSTVLTDNIFMVVLSAHSVFGSNLLGSKIHFRGSTDPHPDREMWQ
jgi:hypothetical protein